MGRPVRTVRGLAGAGGLALVLASVLGTSCNPILGIEGPGPSNADGAVPSCPDPRQGFCHGQCEDLSTDAQCGACDTPCGADVPLGVARCHAGGHCVRCAEGEEPCSTGCARLAEAAADCGACGHDCGGGACVGGVCQPVELVRGLSPSGLVRPDGPWVYFASKGGNEPLVGRVSVAGPACDQAVVSCGRTANTTDGGPGLSAPTAMTVGREGVYVGYGFGTVTAWARDLASWKGIFSAERPVREVFSAGASVVWVDGGSDQEVSMVLSLDPGSQTPRTLFSAAATQVIFGRAALDADRLLLPMAQPAPGQEAVIYSVPLASSCTEGTCPVFWRPPPEPLQFNVPEHALAVASDGVHVVWRTRYGRIYVSKGDGTCDGEGPCPRSLVTGLGAATDGVVAVDRTHAYFTDVDGLHRVPLEGNCTCEQDPVSTACVGGTCEHVLRGRPVEDAVVTADSIYAYRRSQRGTGGPTNPTGELVRIVK